MKKIIRLTESDLERLVKRIIKEEDDFNPVEDAIELLKDNPAYPIQNVAKEVGNQTYEILGLSPFKPLKGYIVQRIHTNVWAMYDNKSRENRVAKLNIDDSGKVTDFRMG
jgi:hypothetical protein